MVTIRRVQICDSLLLAIDEEYVEGVELLLEAEERLWRPGTRAVTKLSEDFTVARRRPLLPTRAFFLWKVPTIEGSLLIKPVPFDLRHLFCLA